jgi:branched-chain amino acid transport system ATP-binding protein
LLEVEQLSASYAGVPALFDVSFRIDEGEIATIIGANGAGKTTILRALSGVQAEPAGHVRFLDQDLLRVSPPRRVGLGLVHVPEGRRLFPFLTVRENLVMGAFTREARKHQRASMERVYTMFPILQEREKQLAGSLSGGQQQMCAIGRGLMARPRLLMIDEPSLGLAPLIVRQIFEIVQQINQQGTTVLLVEQNAKLSLGIANRAYVLEGGRFALSGDPGALLHDERLKQAYMGL